MQCTGQYIECRLDIVQYSANTINLIVLSVLYSSTEH